MAYRHRYLLACSGFLNAGYTDLFFLPHHFFLNAISKKLSKSSNSSKTCHFLNTILFPRNSPCSSEIHPRIFFGQRHHCRVEAHPLSSFPCHNQPQRWWHQKYQVPCSQAEMLQSHPCCTSGFPVRGNRRNEISETDVDCIRINYT